MSKHTPGPWIVVERKHPYKDGSKAHIERNIYTEWKHPQLKGNYPVVCTSVGIGMDGELPIHFARINEEDARLIAAAPTLLEACRRALYALKGREHEQFLRDAIVEATGESK
jgi:hypothetical protein